MQHSTARLIVVGTSIVGGSAYLVAQVILDEMGPLTLSSLRFLLGGVVLLVVSAVMGYRLEKRLLWASVPPGVAFGIAMTCMVIGLQNSLSSIAAFLVCSDAFLLPVVDRVLFRRKAKLETIGFLAIGALGLGFLTLDSGLRVSPSDAWLLLAAFSWAVYFASLAQVVAHFPAPPVSCSAHIVAGVITGVLCLAFERLPDGISFGAGVGILYFAVVISALRFTLKARAQQVLTPSEMGLIFLVEPVSAALFGMALANERLSTQQLIGAALVLTAVAGPSAKRLIEGQRRINY